MTKLLSPDSDGGNAPDSIAQAINRLHHLLSVSDANPMTQDLLNRFRMANTAERYEAALDEIHHFLAEWDVVPYSMHGVLIDEFAHWTISQNGGRGTPPESLAKRLPVGVAAAQFADELRHRIDSHLRRRFDRRDDKHLPNRTRGRGGWRLGDRASKDIPADDEGEPPHTRGPGLN